MLTIRKRRLFFIFILIIGISIAVGLSLFALRQNINLYYTPKQILQKKVSHKEIFRLGGMVVKGSVHHIPNSLKVNFVLTDFHQKIKVNYNGILPSLFREGQGIVAQGKLNSKGIFIADQVLAKHDATYRPPEIKNKKFNVYKNSISKTLGDIHFRDVATKEGKKRQGQEPVPENEYPPRSLKSPY